MGWSRARGARDRLGYGLGEDRRRGARLDYTRVECDTEFVCRAFPPSASRLTRALGPSREREEKRREEMK